MSRFSIMQTIPLQVLIIAVLLCGILISSCKDNLNATGSDGSVAPPNTSALAAASVSTGNGALSGAHYNLNLIGTKDKTADMTNDGHRIFVPLYGTTKIMLTEGDFQVLDANGTDANGAAFQLPNPDPTNSGTTTYSVYARALGKPGGNSMLLTGAVDSTGTLYYSTTGMVQVRSTGGSKFTNVSKDLLYIYADINGDGIVDRVPLFDSRLQDYFWSYDNNGLKVCQLRFYQTSTVVP